MRCPFCSFESTKVVDSRITDPGDSTFLIGEQIDKFASSRDKEVHDKAAANVAGTTIRLSQ